MRGNFYFTVRSKASRTDGTEQREGTILTAKYSGPAGSPGLTPIRTLLAN